MLHKSITLNMTIAGEQGERIATILTVTIVLLMIGIAALGGWSLAVMVYSAVVLGAGYLLVLLSISELWKVLFSKSLFGEDAYTYMTFPISSKSIVLGKFITAMYWSIWSAIVMTTVSVFSYLLYRDSVSGITPWDLDIVETLRDDFVFVGQKIFGGVLSAEAVTFLIGTVIIQILMGAGVLCSGVQLCNLLKHAKDPSGKDSSAVEWNELILVGIWLLCLFVPTKVFCLVTSGSITILPLLITMGLELILTVVLMRWSIKLLQTKYELN